MAVPGWIYAGKHSEKMYQWWMARDEKHEPTAAERLFAQRVADAKRRLEAQKKIA